VIDDEIKRLKENCEVVAENIDDWFEDNDFVMLDKHVADLMESVVFVNVFLLRRRG
jgi:hypothetical protein